MKSQTLQARPRSERGSRAARRLRAAGELPASLYGADKGSDGKTQHQNHDLAVQAYDVMQLIDHHQTVVTVSFDGRRELAIIKEVQRDVFGDDLLHLDLEMIDRNKAVETEVELTFKGDAKGVKEGGSFHSEIYTLTISALPLAIPESVVVDVQDMGVNDYIHIKDLTLPEGVTATGDPEQVVCHVVPPVEEAEEEEAGELAEGGGPAEPEVIGRKKEEEGGEE